MYETKIVDMTQNVVSGWPTPVRCNPGPKQLKQLIAEYEEQGWEMVSVDVNPDSVRFLFWNFAIEATIVTFRREKKDDNPVTDIHHGLTSYGEMWEKEGRPGATQDKSGKCHPKGFNTWDPMGYR